MSLRLTPEHDALDESLAGLVARHAPTSWTREHLEELAAGVRPAYWQPLVESGFLAMHLPEEVGGGGADGVDVAVAVETAGHAMLPGPFVPTRAGRAGGLRRRRRCPGRGRPAAAGRRHRGLRIRGR